MFVGTGADSIEDMLAGFVHAHADVVRLEDGAVVRAARAPHGHAAVVAGGGAGHYPGFAGWVGEGMLDGAVSGQIFSSPSAAQVYRAARAVENGGGVLLAYLNYSGDVIHFGEAAKQLRSEGIAVEEVVIADDVASRTEPGAADGRGIAGAFFVCKVLGAAAASGSTLAEVARLGRRAAERTVTLGASISGCTLPGSVEPMFSLDPGSLAVGLGIHGEPGIRTQELGTPTEVAQLLSAATLEHEPGRADGYGGRVAVLVNSLGGCSHEELFILYAKVREQLEGGDRVLVAPVVGEQLTSLDMVGVSLSAMFLDAELEALWVAAARTASVRRDPGTARAVAQVGTRADTQDDERLIASESSRGLAAQARVALARAAEAAVAHEEELAALDRVGGDGDHGRGMVRGLTAAREAADRAAAAGAGLGTAVAAAGAAWSDEAGGTSGALWGAALGAFASVVGDDATPAPEDLASGLRVARDAVVRLGGAQVGDKTMVDAIEPFVQAFGAAGDIPLGQRWHRAVHAAEAAAQATADLVATKGRARTHGERTRGTPDPGAISFGLVVRAIGEAVAPEQDTNPEQKVEQNR